MGILLVEGCNHYRGHIGVSNDIADAKSRKVFVCEYRANPNPHKINDSLSLFIQEAWLEKSWRYSNSSDKAQLRGGYQICINTDSNSIANNPFGWSIGVDKELYFRKTSNSSLMAEVNLMPIQDTLTIPAQKGQKLHVLADKDTIGYLVLVKVNSTP